MERKEISGYPSIDKPWLKYYSEEAINTPIPECTIYEYLWINNKDQFQNSCCRRYLPGENPENRRQHQFEENHRRTTF